MFAIKEIKYDILNFSNEVRVNKVRVNEVRVNEVYQVFKKRDIFDQKKLKKLKNKVSKVYELF